MHVTHIRTHILNIHKHLEFYNIQPIPNFALHKQENKKWNEFMILVRQGPHANDRLLKHNFRGGEKIKRGQKSHQSVKTTQCWRARADKAVEEEKRGREGRIGKWQGMRLLEPQSDSMIYKEAFVKMPYKPEQEANYKSHAHIHKHFNTHANMHPPMHTHTHTHKHTQLKKWKKRSIKRQ